MFGRVYESGGLLATPQIRILESGVCMVRIPYPRWPMAGRESKQGNLAHSSEPIPSADNTGMLRALPAHSWHALRPIWVQHAHEAANHGKPSKAHAESQCLGSNPGRAAHVILLCKNVAGGSSWVGTPLFVPEVGHCSGKSQHRSMLFSFQQKTLTNCQKFRCK